MQQSLMQLIRLSKFKLDEKKAKLQELRDLSDTLTRNLELLRQEKDREQALAAEDRLASVYFPKYAESWQVRAGNLEETLATVSEEVDQLNDEMSDLFTELKRYEITQDQFQQKKQKKRAKRDSNRLDEAAVQRYRKQV